MRDGGEAVPVATWGIFYSDAQAIHAQERKPN